jgi:hypothetical protein
MLYETLRVLHQKACQNTMCVLKKHFLLGRPFKQIASAEKA